MANLKKILSSVVALALASSMMPMALAENEMAEETTASSASVLFYRDYEDYKSGSEVFSDNGSYTHGIGKIQGTNSPRNTNSKAIKGVDGTAVNLGAGTGSTYLDFAAAPLESGVVYVGFDVEKKTDAEFDELDGTTNGQKIIVDGEGNETTTFVKHENFINFKASGGGQRYSRFGTAHSTVEQSTSPWSDLSVINNISAGYHRYEVFMDLDNDTYTLYLDGVQTATNTYTDNIAYIYFNLSNGIKRWDNVTVVQYPTGCEKSVVLTGKMVNGYKNALVVDFDNYVETVSGETTYAANYPAMMSEVTKDMFTVTAVTDDGETAVEVTGIEKNAAFGSYSLILKDNIDYNATYTVSVTGDLADVYGTNVDATVKATIKPEQPTVLYFRDYEDYATGGEVFGNKYGTVSMGQNDALNEGSKVITGVDGIAVEPKGATGNPPFDLGVDNAITSGIIYIGMDVEMYSDAEYESGAATPACPYITVKGTDSSTGRYIRFAGGTTNTGAWEDIANYGKLAEGNHRLEVMINLDTSKVDSYIDGAYRATTDYARTGFYLLNVWLQKDTVKRWDNFTVVHYPAGMDASFSVAETKGVSYDSNTVTIDFDSDAKTVTSDNVTYKANYPVILNRDITLADVAVTKADGTAVTVSEVKKNAAFGSYDLVFEEALEEGVEYTVKITADDLTDCRYHTLNGKEVTFKTTTPDVWIYRDYEDYKDGREIFNGSGVYGSWTAGASTGFATLTKAEDAYDGKALAVSKEAGEWDGTGAWRYKFSEPIESGKLYIGYDIEKRSDEEYLAIDGETGKCHELLGYLLAGNEWIDANQCYIRMSISDSTVTSGIGNWRNIISNYYLGEGYNRIEYIVDLDANTITRYVNGEQQAQSTYNGVVYGYSQQINRYIKYFDNFTILHIPQGSKAQTFSLQNATAEAETKTVSVQLKSDIKGGEYPIITEALTAEDFIVMDAGGSPVSIKSVAKGNAFGEYVITLDSDITVGDTLTVITTADRTNNLGLTLDTNAGAEAYVSGKFAASVKITADENGTELTEAAIAALKKGDKVYAEVTYANPTEEKVTFTVLGAAYAGGRMTNANMNTFTANAYSAQDNKQYVEIEVTDATNFSAKAFIVNGLNMLTPVK